MALSSINKMKSMTHSKNHSHRKHPKYKQQNHRNLSKKHLQKWMKDTDSFHQELLARLEDNKEQLRKKGKGKYEYCAQIEKKADIIEKTVEEQRDIDDRRHEATDIITSSMT